MGADILFFVEDPGAANYVAQIPGALADRGWKTVFLASGSARDYLLERGLRPGMVERSATAEAILASTRPRVVVVGTAENEDALTLGMISCARRLGVRSVGVVDALMNAEYRFRGRSTSPLAYAPDCLFVPDDRVKGAYSRLGYVEDRVIVCGHPHYDYVRSVAARLTSADIRRLRRSLVPRAPDDSAVVHRGHGLLGILG